jgi:hypothetical protein
MWCGSFDNLYLATDVGVLASLQIKDQLGGALGDNIPSVVVVTDLHLDEVELLFAGTMAAQL